MRTARNMSNGISEGLWAPSIPFDGAYTKKDIQRPSYFILSLFFMSFDSMSLTRNANCKTLCLGVDPVSPRVAVCGGFTRPLPPGPRFRNTPKRRPRAVRPARGQLDRRDTSLNAMLQLAKVAPKEEDLEKLRCVAEGRAGRGGGGQIVLNNGNHWTQNFETFFMDVGRM